MPPSPVTPKLLELYERDKVLYEDLARRVRSLLEDILREGNTAVHSVTARAKEKDSLEQKLIEREPPYAVLEEVTDLAGIRIITYFSDDVDRVGKMIEAEFDVDRKNSVDKRSALDPDRFGYLSLHYVVALSDRRRALPEYRALGERKCEIQVRSVLQHAWAEIEHDLGYKTAGEVPKEVRRRFSRVAGLLELVDSEFIGIRTDLASYAADVPRRIEEEPADVLLDAVSLGVFIESDPTVALLDKRLASLLGGTLQAGPRPELIESFRRLDVSSVKTLQGKIFSTKERVEAFATEWLRGVVVTTSVPIRQGVSLFYLRYVLLADVRDKDVAISILRDADFKDPEAVVARIAKVSASVR